MKGSLSVVGRGKEGRRGKKKEKEGRRESFFFGAFTAHFGSIRRLRSNIIEQFWGATLLSCADVIFFAFCF